MVQPAQPAPSVTLATILDQFRADARNNRDLGDRFERLIEWVMERYQVTRDKDSGIVNDPNDWCKEHNQPRYIIDLVKRVVRVSLETIKIVAGLPGLNERKG